MIAKYLYGSGFYYNIGCGDYSSLVANEKRETLVCDKIRLVKVSAAIQTDFPVFFTLEKFFRGLAESGVDGIEVTVGVKSRLRFKHLEKLSEKYSLPITSFHQPAWSVVGLYIDERFVARAVRLGVRDIVFHPVLYSHLDSAKARRYMERLARIQEKHGINVLFENMPAATDTIVDYFLPGGGNLSDHSDLKSVYKVVSDYGFKMTFDTSHARFESPHKHKEFQMVYPTIGNIHLSSFDDRRQHLPLTMGSLDAGGFINYLVKNKYKGLLTLEIYYPKLLSLNKWDFSAVADSVEIIKNALRK